ncbi:hypothetical protein Tco_1443201, partial [Tanacetum coccineum]
YEETTSPTSHLPECRSVAEAQDVVEVEEYRNLNLVMSTALNKVTRNRHTRLGRLDDKQMHFLLSSISVVYVLTTPILEDGGDATMEQLKKRAKWDNDDYVCRELWDSLEAKYMDEDASSKKFLVSNFTNYKMTDLRPVIEQYNELLGILRRFTQHKMNMDEAIQVSCITDKLPPSWKDFKHTLKHLKEDLTLVELGSHLRIEEPSGCKIVTIQ